MTGKTMRDFGRVAMALGLMVMAISSTAAAQRRGLVRIPEGDRGGFWGSFGLAAGQEQLDLRDGAGYSDRLTKPVIQAKLGGTVNQNLRLGVEFFDWFNSANGVKERVGHFAGIAQVYPVASAGFFIKGATGVAFSSVQLDTFTSTTDLGFSYGGGLGYEVKVGRNVYIVPTVDYYQQTNSSGPQQNFHERFLNIGINVQFQAGRRL